MFKQRIRVYEAEGERSQEIAAWVDSGSTYTWLPAHLLPQLGLRPTGQREFILADGSSIQRDIAQVRIQIDPTGERFYTYSVFGDDQATPLLGAVALEEAGLGIDPVNERLVPAPGYALTAVERIRP